MSSLNYCQALLGLGQTIQHLCYTPRSPEDTNLENRVKQEQQAFLKDANIRKELHIWEHYAAGLADQRGLNISCLAEPIIRISPGLRELDPEAFSWIIKQQIYHIKYNHSLSRPLLHTAVCAGSQFLLNFLQSSFWVELGKQLVIYNVSCRISQWYSRYCTNCADDYAIKHSNAEELKGARRELKALQAVSAQNYKPGNPAYKPNGDVHWDYSPTYSERIQRVEAALAASGVNLSQLENNRQENTKIARLIQFVNNQNQPANRV